MFPFVWRFFFFFVFNFFSFSLFVFLKLKSLEAFILRHCVSFKISVFFLCQLCAAAAELLLAAVSWTTFCCSARASHCSDFSYCGAWAEMSLLRALSPATVSFEWRGLAWQSWTSTAGGAGSIPGQRTTSVHTVWPRIKKQTNQKAQKREWRKFRQDFTIANSFIFVWLICSSFGVSTISSSFFLMFNWRILAL